VAAVFFTNAAVFANVVPRYPDIKAALGLSNTGLGSAIAAFPLGALLAGLLAAPLMRRLGSAVIAAAGTMLLAFAVLLLAVASSWVGLAAVLLVAGALDAVIDVAQNAHGLRVQRLYGRSIVNSFHGVWSIGAVVGGLMGSAAAGLSLPLGPHLLTASVLFSLVAMIAYRFLLPGPEDAERAREAEEVAALEGHASSPTPPPPRDRRGAPAVVKVLLTLGVLAACGALAEDSASSWSALYLRSYLAVPAAAAGLGFVAFQAAMTTGRLLGDRVVDRFGQRHVVRTGGLLAAAGMGGALALPSPATGLFGYGLVGLGVATVVPPCTARTSSADSAPGLG
jgi:MFS family permease